MLTSSRAADFFSPMIYGPPKQTVQPASQLQVLVLAFCARRRSEASSRADDLRRAVASRVARKLMRKLISTVE